MPKYIITAEYLDTDGDLVEEDAEVEAENEAAAQDALAEDIGHYFEDADDGEAALEELTILRVREA